MALITEESKQGFNISVFCLDLNNIRNTRHRNWKEVSNESGVSASSLTRLMQGKKVDLNNLSKLIIWSGLTFEHYL